MAAGERAEAVHGLLHEIREGVVVGVAALPRLEEHVGVLGRAAQHRVLGRQGAGAVGGHQRVVDHRAHGVGLDGDDLGDLVGGAEAVEEVDHRDAPGQGGGLGDQRHVLGFLHRIAGQERAAGGAAGHHVGVIAEDRQGVGGQRPRRHVEHEGRQLAGHLVEVGHEQQQALAGGEAGAQRPRGERPVQRAGGAAFGLHLDDLGDHAPQVRLALGGPFIGPLAHVGRGRDRVDGNHLAAEIGHPSGGFVAVEIEIRRHWDPLLGWSAAWPRRWRAAAVPVGIGNSGREPRVGSSRNGHPCG